MTYKACQREKYNELLQLILKPRYKSINKIDLQREIRTALILKKKQQLNNSLQTTKNE